MKNDTINAENEILDSELDNISGGAMTFQQAQDPSRYDTSIWTLWSRSKKVFGW